MTEGGKGRENITKNRIDIVSTNGWVFKRYTHGKRRRETRDRSEIRKGIKIEN